MDFTKCVRYPRFPRVISSNLMKLSQARPFGDRQTRCGCWLLQALTLQPELGPELLTRNLGFNSLPRALITNDRLCLMAEDVNSNEAQGGSCGRCGESNALLGGSILYEATQLQARQPDCQFHVHEVIEFCLARRRDAYFQKSSLYSSPIHLRDLSPCLFSRCFWYSRSGYKHYHAALPTL